MRVTLYTHEKDCANVRDTGWIEGSTYESVEVAAPRKEDVVYIGGKRHVVREVQWIYVPTGVGHFAIAEALVFLWRTT
jgi:hypothetical protein